MPLDECGEKNTDDWGAGTAGIASGAGLALVCVRSASIYIHRLSSGSCHLGIENGEGDTYRSKTIICEI